MRKILLGIASVSASLCMAGGMAAAATTSSCPVGTIEDTGPGSTNVITCKTTNDTHVTCINNIYVVGNNGQAASTGDVTSEGNTNSGVVVSGSATNDSNQTVNVGASCEAAAPVPAPTPTPTPTTPSVLSTSTTAAPAKPQVKAPVGAVSAGSGGSAHISGTAVTGLFSSLGVVGLGTAALRKRLLGR